MNPHHQRLMPKTGNPERHCDSWNKHNPIGTPVDVTLDNGNIMETKTNSLAWVLGGHSAVIKLDGIVGAYSLVRVHPSPKK